IGNDRPLLVESRMLTVAALIGALALPPGFHVIVCWPAQTTKLLGEVTTSGPPLVTTVTIMSALFTPPPPARLSRAVTRNCIVRLVDGSSSPAVIVLLSTSESWGNIREELKVGPKERKSGLLPLSGDATEQLGPRSRSSQQYVTASPSMSLPDAVNIN